MKKTIIIAILLFNLAAAAQNDTSYIGKFRAVDTFVTTYDTIPVLMLLSDTASLVKSEIDNRFVVTERLGVAFWVKGYRARKIDWYYHEPVYLDGDKKPLRKTTVIWIIRYL